MVEDVLPNEGGYGRELPFRVYLPPCYGWVAGDWPTIYLLHGLGGDYDFWPDLGLVEHVEAGLSAAGARGYLVVMPWQRTGLDFEPAMVDGLIPMMERRYNARGLASGRALGGISRGGGWAFRLGLRHPELFGRVGLHSPGLLGGDLIAVGYWLEGYPGRIPQVRVDIGDKDGLLPAAEELVQRLADLGVDHEFTIGSGRHEAAYWQGNLDDYLRWYTQDW